ncbi:MAG: hypothetical protein JJU11_00650 [Candidatus Sumerlaeia bacterium]|nr:hypothetical protein [Candidatus Sumerlaeia bacterium]
MPAIMIFQKDATGLTVAEISDLLHGSLAVDCCLYKDGERIPLEDVERSGGEIASSTIWVNLPDWEEEEGNPTALVEVTPRLDREEPVQHLVDELLTQDASLDADLNHNSRDILITFEDTPAGEESAYALAYVIASETSSGILVPAFEEGDDTAWFEDPEDFADIVFGDDEDIDDDEEE